MMQCLIRFEENDSVLINVLKLQLKLNSDVLWKIWDMKYALQWQNLDSYSLQPAVCERVENQTHQKFQN